MGSVTSHTNGAAIRERLAELLKTDTTFTGNDFADVPGYPGSVGAVFSWAKRSGLIEWATTDPSARPMTWRATSTGRRWAL